MRNYNDYNDDMYHHPSPPPRIPFPLGNLKALATESNETNPPAPPAPPAPPRPAHKRTPHLHS